MVGIRLMNQRYFKIGTIKKPL